MFPIVPFNLNLKNNNVSSSDNITSYVTGSSKLLVPGKVISSTYIAQGAMSVAIEPMKLLGQPDVVQISVGQNSFGTIDLEPDSKEVWCKDMHWVRALRLSNDCHSYNIQLRLQPSQRPHSTLNKNTPTPKLILEAVRPIESGQELLLWFSEDILAMLQIVFLTLANIQGQKKYVCTRCSALYESPNPLKLHITLNCGRYPISILWDKLSNIMTENVLHRILQQEMFDFKLSPEPPLIRQRNAIDLSTTSSSHREDGESVPRNILYRPYSEPSAFIPFKRLKSLEDNSRSPPPPRWPIVPFDQDLYMQQFANVKYNDDAQMETLVSSLGKSKEGHICLYCGKCYSRKYGLKIHIRTHTGYKPLKCKFCLRPFGDPSNLNKHVRLHAEGNTPYKCDLCGKILVRRRDLERHLKSRHMIEMHPGLNLLDDSNNENVDISDDDQKSSTPVS